jgi:hypothetical protein
VEKWEDKGKLEIEPADVQTGNLIELFCNGNLARSIITSEIDFSDFFLYF